jgi:hypothetical protein
MHVCPVFELLCVDARLWADPPSVEFLNAEREQILIIVCDRPHSAVGNIGVFMLGHVGKQHM